MEADEPFDLETAWADLRHAIRMMLVICGGCAMAVAERLILTRAARTEILQWLAPIEATARRLLLIEALKLPAPNVPAPFSPKGKLSTAYADKPTPELAEDETQWNVRFNAWAGVSASGNKKAGVTLAPQNHPIQFNAYPLARRIEALCRLFDQREAYAARLALRVHHAPAQARKAFAPYRHRATAVQTLLRLTQGQVDLALAAFNTS